MSQHTCEIDDCTNRHYGHGFCNKHYKRWKKYGDPLSGAAFRVTGETTCSIPDCADEYYGQGYCSKHYQRWYKHGDPLSLLSFADPKEALLNRTQRNGGCLTWTGSKDYSGYGTILISGKTYRVHRYVWEQKNGPIPEGMQIDHTCWNVACVNINHLRIATPSQNSAYRSSASSNSSSGLRNVYKDGSKWKVQVKKEGVLHYLGRFDCPKEAAKVAENARQDLFGDFAGRG
jgi:hypothetical protein